MKLQPVPLDYFEAIRLILSKVTPTSSIRIDLEKALGRVVSNPLHAKLPQPGFDQSTRDGFVIADNGVDTEEGFRQYTIGGEIHAGPANEYSLPPGVAFRIMTGGLVPINGKRVVPYEECQGNIDLLKVSEKALSKPDKYIRRCGSHITSGQLVAETGEVIGAEHLALFAATGLLSVEVHEKVNVSFFCTGNELVSAGKPKQLGMKISSNRYQMNGLIHYFGAIADDRGVVGDSIEEVGEVFGAMNSDKTDVVVSTGGMGPGKCDILEEAFVRAGGQVLYRSLNMRPGQSTIFGLMNSMLFFGLPGPPTAVRILFNELIRPVLLAMQGVKTPLPRSIKAFLVEGINTQMGSVYRLKGGHFSFDEGRCRVRLTRRNELATCYLLFKPYKNRYEEGELITVHFTDSPLLS